MSGLSLRARLTLWYTLALVAVLGLFAAEVVWVQGRIGLARVDSEIDGLLTTLINIVTDELKEQDTIPSADEALREVSAAGRAVAILDASGVPLKASWSGLDPQRVSMAAGRGPGVWTEQTSGDAWRLHARLQHFDTVSLILIAGIPLADMRREQREVQEAMIIGIPIALLLAGGGGFWLASIGLRPISDMARQAGRISLTGIEALGPSERRDELGQFARAFNSLVDRLRASLHTQRQFMADASHELRTPVSIVRTTAEVMLSRDRRDEGEYREALAIVGEQSRRLGRLVDQMLVLARADAGGYPIRLTDLYVDEVVAESCRAVEVLAAERGVTIRAGAPADLPCRGDEDLLRQLILNVLQNAVQHTPSGGLVSVDLRRDAETIRIRVTDTGAGIPLADQGRIFDRFVQLDAARRGHGAGLGLPIARWIAEAHHGVLALEASGPAGTTFCLTLPAS